MGLSVVLGIVRAHGEGIAVVCSPGRGSVFRVFLPVRAEDARLPRAIVENALEIDRGGTVLLVDDEEAVRQMAKIMLMKLGFVVLEAEDGTEAVAVFQRHRDEICCVLTDFTMPRMNGWDTLAALRMISPDIPVILSNGYDESRVMEDRHPERPDAFLGKPYRIQQLRDAILHELADKKEPSLKDLVSEQAPRRN